MAERAELEAARRNMLEAARVLPSGGRIGRSGRHTMRVDARAFFNAIEGNGGVDRRGRTVWDDPGFCEDMQRLHPECCVGVGGGRRSMAHGMRNRFGRVSWRKVY